MSNPENLPKRAAIRGLLQPSQQSDSLVARGLAVIRESAGQIAKDGCEELYCKARQIFDRAEIGTEQGIILDWDEASKPALFSAFALFEQLARKSYGKAYYPLAALWGAKDNMASLKKDEAAALRRRPIGKEYWSAQLRKNFESKAQFRYFSKLAFDWCFANQENSDAELWCDLGYLYRNGCGVAKDDMRAEIWFRKAAEHGHVRAQYMLGFCLEYANKGEEAAQWYLMAADHGDADAQCMMGSLYDCDFTDISMGVMKDEAKSAYYYLKAAEQGNDDAIRAISNMYGEGRGVEKNDEQAVYWMRRGAEQDDFVEQWHLGCAYMEGRGVDRDEKKAVCWFRKAAVQGYRDAQIALDKLGIDWKK